jgi:peroxiredoxin Q/BCP
MKLAAGMVAPAFQATDVFGRTISLSSTMEHPVLLSFYRNGACALCNLQVHQLIEKYPAYHARGLEIVAVFESPRESILQYVGKQDAPFPIIADPEARLYTLYGVETSEAKVMAGMDNPFQKERVAAAIQLGFQLTREEGSNFFRLPADFLIRPDLVIEQALYSEVIGEHLSFDTIDQFLRQTA